MTPKWHRTVSALGDAVSGSRGHDAAGRKHTTVPVSMGSGKGWRVWCGTCREWVTEVVGDKKSAEQAGRAHEREAMK